VASGLDESQRRTVEGIFDSAEHLRWMIEDLLDLGRIEAGKLELTPAPQSLADIVRFVDDVIRVRAERKGLRFTCEFEGELPAVVVVDEKRLRQVLLNLLGNAVKYTTHGHIAFRLRTRPDDADGAAPYLRFEVEDSGSGIAAADLHRIFQPFEQVDAERNSGVGLGLTISRRIVQAMASDIHVDTELGVGSRFWFELRLALPR
jgi:signal transduction histidine kinase